MLLPALPTHRAVPADGRGGRCHLNEFIDKQEARKLLHGLPDIKPAIERTP